MSKPTDYKRLYKREKQLRKEAEYIVEKGKIAIEEQTSLIKLLVKTLEKHNIEIPTNDE